MHNSIPLEYSGSRPRLYLGFGTGLCAPHRHFLAVSFSTFELVVSHLNWCWCAYSWNLSYLCYILQHVQHSYMGSKLCLSMIYSKNVLLHIPQKRIVGMAVPKTTKRCTDAVCKHAAIFIMPFFFLCLLWCYTK